MNRTLVEESPSSQVLLLTDRLLRTSRQGLIRSPGLLSDETTPVNSVGFKYPCRTCAAQSTELVATPESVVLSRSLSPVSTLA